MLDAHLLVNATKPQLLALKDGKGHTRLKFMSCLESGDTFKDLQIEKSASDEAKTTDIFNTAKPVFPDSS